MTWRAAAERGWRAWPVPLAWSRAAEGSEGSGKATHRATGGDGDAGAGQAWSGEAIDHSPALARRLGCRTAGAIALLMLSGCAVGRGRLPPTPRTAATWRTVATSEDRERLRGWRETWLEALGRARASGAGGALAAEGALFEPDAALPGAPPPGGYRCRLFKLGANGAAMREFTQYPAFGCRIDAAGERLTFVRPGDRQRAAGRLFADSATRTVFLGALSFTDERAAPAYGRDARRDMAGLVERVGERRWRIVLPRPRFESLLDVIELVPDPAPAS